MVKEEIVEGTRSPRKAYVAFVVPLMLILLASIVLVFMTEGNNVDVAAIEKDQEPKNKLVDLANEVYYYFWEDARPKPIEEPESIGYVQRLWNYVMPQTA